MLNKKLLKTIAVFFVFLLLIIIPFVNLPRYVIRILVFSGIYILLASSLNFSSGIAGQVSLGHAAYFGIGAYTSALLALKLNFSFPVCMIFALVTTGALGFLVSIPAVRLSGAYLAIVTLGFGQIVNIIMLNWLDVTRGPMGLVSIPPPMLFGFEFSSPGSYYYLVLITCILTLLFFNNLIKSKFGRNLMALRDDENAAVAMGINISRDKVIALTISSAIAGIAGALYAHFMLFISPSSFTGEESTAILSMVVLGGLGNMTGSVFSALILTALPELLRDFSQYRMLVYGFLLVIMMILKTWNWDNFALVRKLRNDKRFKFLQRER